VSDRVEIYCGPVDESGKRLVVATLGELQHRDKIDCDSQFQRQKFRERLIGKFQLSDDAHESIEAQILAAADAEDCRDDSGLAPVVVNLADVQAEQITWFWPNRIPMGKLSVVAGDPGLGKSFLTIDFASRCSTGTKWFDCDGSAPLGSTVILNAEDSLGDTIKPRLVAAGADCSKVVALQAVRGGDVAGDYERSIDLQRDLTILEKTIADLCDCKLAIIDPLSAYLGKVDSHRNADVRSVLAPLSAMAGRHGVAVVAVDHLTKGEAKAIYKVTGSIAFTGAARSVWAVTRDRDDPTERRRLFLPIKSNLAERQPGLAFVLSTQHGMDGTPCVAWEAGDVDITADEAMATEPRRRGPEADDRADAELFLRESLACGPRQAREVEEEAREVHSIAKRTLDRARKSIGVEAFRDTIPGPWLLRLSTLPATLPTSPKNKLLGNLGTVADIPSKNVLKSVNGSNNAKLFEYQVKRGGLPPEDDF
jgi:putative DNA primase/helicase